MSCNLLSLDLQDSEPDNPWNENMDKEMFIESRYAPTQKEIQENRIWSFLAKHDFAWLAPTSILESSTKPITLPVTKEVGYPVIHSCAIFAELYQPILFIHSGDWPSELPPTEFVGKFHRGNTDPLTEFEAIREKLCSELGAYESSNATNVYSAKWECWPASIQIISWPRELNQLSYRPGAWIGDEKSRESVHVYINAGLSLALTESERSALQESSLMPYPQGILKVAQVGLHRHYIGPMSCFRRLKDSYSGLDGLFPKSHQLRLGKECFGLFRLFDDSVGIYDLSEIERLTVSRLTPARGCGSSSLSFKYLDSKKKGSYSQVSLVSASGPDDLTDFANKLSIESRIPLVLEPYSPDC